MLNRSKKQSQMDKLSDHFSRSKASFLVNCIGLNVEQVTELRKNLKKNKGDIQIIRNSLSLRVMEDYKALKEAYKPQMEGPNAFILAFEDPAKIAKIIDQFSEDNELFKVKGAVLEGSSLSPAELKSLARLPSLDVLKAQFLGLLETPLTKFLATIQEVPQSFVRILSEERKKKESS